MRINKGKNKNNIKQRTAQKGKLNFVLTAGILSFLISGVLIYINVSKTTNTHADNNHIASSVNYRTTEHNIPNRLLIDADLAERISTANPEEKTKGVRITVSRSKDIIITKSSSQ